VKRFNVHIEYPGGKHVTWVEAYDLEEARAAFYSRVSSACYRHTEIDDEGTPYWVIIMLNHATKVSIKECQ